MTDLSDALARYLIIRRALGYKLQSQEIRLRGFVAFMAHRSESVITSRLAVEWSGLQCGPATWGSRLSTVRAFANHVALSDPHTEVPPFGSLRAPAPTSAVHLLGCPGRRSHGHHGLPSLHWATGADLPMLLRPDRDLRPALQRGSRPTTGGHQPGGRRADHPRDEVRQVPGHPPTRVRPRGCFGATPRIGIVAQHDGPARSSSPATAALSSTTPTPTRRSSTGPDWPA